MILAAAIHKDGVTYIGRRHDLIMHSKYVPWGFFKGSGGKNQGFVTTDGEFLDRKQAAKHALACGQIKELKYQKNELFSEELW